MDFQDASQWTNTLKSTYASSFDANESKDVGNEESSPLSESCSETNVSGLELKVSRIKEIKHRLFAISKSLKQSNIEKADLMKRIGNIEIQLMNLKELRVEEDFRKISKFHKDISETSRIHLMNLITDTKILMDNKSFHESAEINNSEEKTEKKEPAPEVEEVPLDPESKQKWVRRMLAGKTNISMPSISESQRVVYSKQPHVPVFAVDSQISQLTKNQCSTLPSETEVTESSEQ